MKNFCLTVPIKVVGEHFRVSKEFWYRKFSSKGGWKLHGFVEIFCLTGPKRKTLLRNPSVFQKISGIEKNLWIRGGMSRFSVEIFVSHSVEKFRKGILLFLRKFLVSKSFMDEKGGCHVFPSKIFGLTVPKNIVGIPSMLQKIWGIEKVLCNIGGITFFRRKFLVSQCRKISWASLQCFRKIGVSKNFYV